MRDKAKCHSSLSCTILLCMHGLYQGENRPRRSWTTVSLRNTLSLHRAQILIHQHCYFVFSAGQRDASLTSSITTSKNPRSNITRNTSTIMPGIEFHLRAALNRAEEEYFAVARRRRANWVELKTNYLLVQSVYETFQKVRKGKAEYGEGEQAQEQFMSGATRLMVATNAFGMGSVLPYTSMRAGSEGAVRCGGAVVVCEARCWTGDPSGGVASDGFEVNAGRKLALGVCDVCLTGDVSGLDLTASCRAL